MPEITLRHDPNELVIGLGNGAVEAARQVGLAEAQVALATAQADRAEDWAEGTEPGGSGTKSAREYSEAASDFAGFAEEFSGPAYASQAAGEAATTEGQFFRVPIGTVPETYTRYQRTASGSVEAAQLATTSALASPEGASLIGTRDGNDIQTTIDANAVLASPTVNALRAGRDLTAGRAQVVATRTGFEQEVEVTPFVTERWRGVVRANGLHFHVPSDATTVLIHDADSGRAWQTDFGLDLSGTNKWRGAVVGRDGRIYCIPYTAANFLVIDPVAMTATLETLGLPAATLSVAGKWNGGVLARDGLIYCAPYNSTVLLVIDPANQTARTMTAAQLTLVATALNTTAKYSGAVAVGGKVYCIPFGASNALVVDIANMTATQPNYGLTLTDGAKWAGAVVHGSLVYCAPFTATDILVIDTVAATAVRTAMGATLTGGEKWSALVSSGGKMVGIPAKATDFLVIDPLDTTGSPQGTATRETFNVYDFRNQAAPGGLVSSFKWSGGVAYKGAIYGCPCGGSEQGQDILFIDVGAAEAYHTDLGVYLPTSTGGSTKWFGAVVHPNGYIYGTPATATDFLIIKDDDESNDRPVAVRHNLGVTLAGTHQKFQGGVLGGDSCIYIFPRSTETRICKIDPSDLTASPYGTATLTDYGGARDRETGATGVALGTGATDEQKWHSNVLGLDGKIYGVPYSAQKVLIMDPDAPDSDKLELTDFGLDLSGIDKWVGGCLHPNGKIYCGVRSRANMLIIDTDPNSPTYNQAWLTDFGVDINTLSNCASVFMKYSFPQLGADGRIYFMPRTARNIMVLDPSDTSTHEFGNLTFETLGLDWAAVGDGYYNTIASKTGPDGRIYACSVDGIQAGTDEFLVIDTIEHTAFWTDFGLGTALNTSNKLAGCVQSLTGRMIFIPRSAGWAVTIKPTGVPPLPPAAVLGPYLNKC